MSIAQNLEQIRTRIAKACAASGRQIEEVTLIAVSKSVPLPAILEAYEAGHRHFGESRLQEALPKMEALPSEITWHFIGGLQSNKAKAIANRFASIHSLCKRSQLTEIEKCSQTIDGLIEVNIAEEPQKDGILPSELDEFVPQVLQCEHIRFRGLMTIGPANQNAEVMRPYFNRIRELNQLWGGTWLSIGMSNDFDVAIQEGATHVRVGTAIFGNR